MAVLPGKFYVRYNKINGPTSVHEAIWSEMVHLRKAIGMCKYIGNNTLNVVCLGAVFSWAVILNL